MTSEAQTTLTCPECGSPRCSRNGYTKGELGVDIQRYKCEDCGRRFSDEDDIERAKAVLASYLAEISPNNIVSLNAKNTDNGTTQISAENTVKNLGNETQQVNSVSDVQKADGTNIDLVIADYKHYIQKEHKVNDLTLSKYIPRLRWLATEIHVNLYSPDDFKTKLAFDPVLSAKSNCNKNSICKAYTSFVKQYLHMEDVKIPRFEYKTPEYHIPQTQHMELLYVSFSFQMQVFCFVLMATAARPVETLRIEWKDIDFARKTIAINKPAKHGRTRTIQLKGRFVKVIDMLVELRNRQYNIATCRNRTQRNMDRVFTYKDTDAAGLNFRRARKRAAVRLGIPELEKITFYSNRHWRAVLERFLKGNSDAVANLLGENSDKYVAVYAPISERLYGSDKEFEPIEISEADPDYSEKMDRYGKEGYNEYNYNRTTGRHYLRKEKSAY
ncbi:MAG: tyrosine-type recombinase/integrase [Candidatus Bathyarchaeia archaeon]|jgi:integrase/transposase-like protein